ncbi:MAG TPA: hypothetical protein VGP43_05550 [Chitinophagaceae bacterium]|nr:hypothetical protein [Chitinophagaceae bacterium]
MAFLIDKYLPEYTYNEYHKKIINASAKECFLATKDLDMAKSFISTSLMKLRGLPTKEFRLQGFLKNMCFIYLEEDIYKEFVIDASQQHLKMIWNFYFKEIDKNKTLVSTETRILCLTKRSKILFSLYWFFVKPFSGIIRIEMLRLIKTKVENKR